MKNPHDIILRPVLTEKGYNGIADKHAFTFHLERIVQSGSRYR